jgi:hypothetical protein
MAVNQKPLPSATAQPQPPLARPIGQRGLLSSPAELDHRCDVRLACGDDSGQFTPPPIETRWPRIYPGL